MTNFPFYTSCFTCCNKHLLVLQVEMIKKKKKVWEPLRSTYKKELRRERWASCILLNEWTLIRMKQGASNRRLPADIVHLSPTLLMSSFIS